MLRDGLHQPPHVLHEGCEAEVPISLSFESVLTILQLSTTLLTAAPNYWAFMGPLLDTTLVFAFHVQFL